MTSSLPSRIELQDICALVARGTIGAIPLVGPMIAEIAGAIIPGQRQDRFEEFLRILDQKLSQLALDKEDLARRFKSETFIDLLEDGTLQAVRSVSRERKEYIATLLARGMSVKDLDHARAKKLLLTLNDLTDPEVIVLKSFSMDSRRREAFVAKYPEIFGHADAREQSTEDQDRRAFLASYHQSLLKSGLLRQDRGYAITDFGNMLIEFIWEQEDVDKKPPQGTVE